jgi:hypothetical protein
MCMIYSSCGENAIFTQNLSQKNLWEENLCIAERIILEWILEEEFLD